MKKTISRNALLWKTLYSKLTQFFTHKKDAAELNNYRRSQQIHYDDLLK